MDQKTFDGMVKCYSRSEFVSDLCYGYCKNNSYDTNIMCIACQLLAMEQDRQRKIVMTENLKSKIAARTKIVMKLRKEMEEKKKQRQHRLKDGSQEGFKPFAGSGSVLKTKKIKE